MARRMMNQPDTFGNVPMLLLCKNLSQSEINTIHVLKTFLEFACDIEYFDFMTVRTRSTGENILHGLSDHGLQKCVRAICDPEMKIPSSIITTLVTQQDKNGLTPLCIAGAFFSESIVSSYYVPFSINNVAHRHRQTILVLLDAALRTGVELDASHLQECLYWAAHTGDLELCREAIGKISGKLDSGSFEPTSLGPMAVYVPGKLGQTPLHAACAMGHFKVAQYFQAWSERSNYPFDINVRDDNGDTPFKLSVQTMNIPQNIGKRAQLTALLQLKADPHVKNKKYNRCLQYARPEVAHEILTALHKADGTDGAEKKSHAMSRTKTNRLHLKSSQDVFFSSVIVADDTQAFSIHNVSDALSASGLQVHIVKVPLASKKKQFYILLTVTHKKLRLLMQEQQALKKLLVRNTRLPLVEKDSYLYEPVRSLDAVNVVCNIIDKVGLNRAKARGILKDTFLLQSPNIHLLLEAYIPCTRTKSLLPVLFSRDYTWREDATCQFALITTIEQYFGQGTASYFFIQVVILNWMFYLAMPGLLMTIVELVFCWYYVPDEVIPSLGFSILQQFSYEPVSRLSSVVSIWGLVGFTWALFTVAKLRRKEIELCHKFDVDSSVDQHRFEADRKEFKGDEHFDHNTNTVERRAVSTPFQRCGAHVLTTLAGIIVLALLLTVIFFALVLKEWLYLFIDHSDVLKDSWVLSCVLFAFFS